MIRKEHPLPRTRRCELLDIPRSSSYYHPKPVSEEDQTLMRLVDKIHLERPYLGSRRIVDALVELGYKADRKRVQRLMRLMGAQVNPSRTEDLKVTSAAQGLSLLIAKLGY